MNNRKHRFGIDRLLSIRFDTVGSVLPMAAAGMFILVLLIGGGVDLSRAYQAKNRLQYACDAGVLAGRRAVSSNGFDTAAEAQADKYFDGNFDDTLEDVHDTTFTPTSNDNGNTIEGVAATTLDTVIMRVVGFDTIPLSATCSASMAVGNSDVVMVLDTTGSMGWNLSGTYTTRLSALQTAMKNFYDTVAASASGSTARIRFGFVPYSSAINVGHLLPSSYLVDTLWIQSRVPDFTQEEVQEFESWDEPVASSETGYSAIDYGRSEDYGTGYYYSRSSCEAALPADDPWTDYGSPTTTTTSEVNRDGQLVETETVSQPQRSTEYFCSYKRRHGYYREYHYLYRDAYYSDINTSDPIYTTTTQDVFSGWTYKFTDFDVSTYKLFQSATAPVGDDGTNITSTWDGCIEERQTDSASSFSFSSLYGMSPSDALDLDIDSAPDPSDPATQWKPMWPELAFHRGETYTDSRGRTRFRVLDVPESESGEQVSSNCPQRAQLLKTMTESEFDAYADSLWAQGNTYHDLGILWGARLSSPDGIFSSNVTAAPSNGGSVARHLIFMTDGEMQPNNDLYTTYGIEFHDQRVTDDGSTDLSSRHSSRFLALCEAVKAKGIRLWVIALATSLTTNLQTCASTDSAFVANDADELNETFQEIAKDVGELRIVQ